MPSTNQPKMGDAIFHINTQVGAQCTDLRGQYITVGAGIVSVKEHTRTCMA